MGAWQNDVGAWYALLVAGILLVGPTLSASRFRRSEDSGENCELLAKTSQQCFNKAQEAFTETMKHEGDPDPDTCTLKTCVYLEALSECSTHLLACEGEEKVQQIKDEKMEDIITNRDCKKWNTEKCNIMKMYMDRNPDIGDNSMDYGTLMDHQVEDEKKEGTDDVESDDQDDEETDDVESDDQDDEEKANEIVTEIVEAEAVVIEEKSAALVESVDTETEDGENVDETDTEPDANNDKNAGDGNAEGEKENDKDEDDNDNENKGDDIGEDKQDESDDDDAAAAKTNDNDGDDNDNENKEDDSEEDKKDESDDDDDDNDDDKKASGKDTMMLSTTLLFAIVINSIR